MVIWRGWGLLVVVIVVGILMLTQLGVDAISGQGTYTENSSLYASIGFLVSAVIVWLLGKKLNRQAPSAPQSPYSPQIPQAPQVSQAQFSPQDFIKTAFSGRHSLFFLRMEYWAFVFIAIALVSLLVQK